MRTLTALVLAFFLLVPFCRAENWTVKGKTYSNVTVTKVDADKVHIMYDGGIGSVNLSDLPPDQQKKFNYDPNKAAAAQAQAAQQAVASDAVVQKAAEQNKVNESYEMLFELPAKDKAGKLGGVMLIDAEFSNTDRDANIVSFKSVAEEGPPQHWIQNQQGAWLVGGPETINYDAEIAVYGLPSSFAQGSTWHGWIYPAGTKQLDTSKYQIYATSKELAIKLLQAQKQ